MVEYVSSDFPFAQSDQMKLSVSMFIMDDYIPHPAVSYGIICLAMAYVVHLMNSSVLQVSMYAFMRADELWL